MSRKGVFLSFAVLIACSARPYAQTPTVELLQPDSVTQSSAVIPILVTLSTDTHLSYSLVVGRGDVTSTFIYVGPRDTSGLVGMNVFRERCSGLYPGLEYQVILKCTIQGSGQYTDTMSFQTLKAPKALNLLVPLTITSRDSLQRILYMGLNTYATNKMDAIFGEEEEPPPPPSGGFDVRLIGDGLGLGSQINFRRLSSLTQRDTFTVRLYTDRFPLTISWPSLTTMFAGNVFLRTMDTIVDMKTSTSCVISDPDVPSIRIVTEHPTPSDSVLVILPLRNSYDASTNTYFHRIVFPSNKTSALWLEWGPSTAYGYSTPQLSVDSGASIVPFDAVVPNLKGVPFYHCRMAAQEGSVVWYGPDEVLDNQFGHPQRIWSFYVSKITDSSAVVSLSLDQFLPKTEDTVWLDWGTSAAYEHKRILTPTPYQRTSFHDTLTDLQPATLYYLRPSVANENGFTQGREYRIYTGMPSAKTLPTDSVTMTTAVVHALCNPHGRLTRAFFVYTEYYNRQTTDTIAFAPDTVDHSILRRLVNLKPGGSYSVYLIAQYDSLEFNVVYADADQFSTHANPDAAGLVSSLRISNGLGGSDLVHFGVYTDATDCIDGGLGEMEYPPPFVSGQACDSRLVDARPRSNCLGMGVKFDLRPYTSVAQADTYKVKFGVATDAYPARLEWPVLDSSYAGSVTLVTAWDTADMKKVNSFTFNSSDVDAAWIIARQPLCTPGAPLVITDAAAAASGAGSVLLSARVNANELPTTAWFEWGDSLQFTASTPPQDAGSVRNFVPIRAALTLNANVQTLRYRAVAQNSRSLKYGEDRYVSVKSLLSVGEGKSLPRVTKLYQNFPNPFNPSTSIAYDLSRRSLVTLKVYNVLGQVVQTLVEEVQDAGHKSVVWHADVPSGIYFYRLTAGSFTDMKKALIIR